MLVTCMGGTIGFHSQLNKGSAFYIVLPLKTLPISDRYHDATDQMVGINDTIPQSELLLIDLKKRSPEKNIDGQNN